MTPYKHTQIGYLILSILTGLSVFYTWLYTVISGENGPNTLAVVLMAFVLFILGSFATLKVTLDENYLRIKFGYGIFRKKFLLKDIVSAKAVKNCWYYGWGVRLWLWPYMWIYNVSGFDAVEINMRDGKIYRIGTDDTAGLLSALTKVPR